MRNETSFKIYRNGSMVILLLILSIALPVLTSSYEYAMYSASNTNQHHLSAETPNLSLTYTTRTNLTATPIESGDTIGGDHLILKAEWTSSIDMTRLEVDAPAIPAFLEIEGNQSTLELDTRTLGNNATCTITCTAWLSNGTVLSFDFTDVYIGNYFVPKVTVLAPNGNETWEGVHNITWLGKDHNIDDTLIYDVFYSSDSGMSFVTLISSTNLTWFEWDCSNLIKTDTYLIEVRVRDGIYFSSDRSDWMFTAGTITTTTTPPTSPTTTPTGPELRIIVFITILLFSSGVMALVVYYAARKWF